MSAEPFRFVERERCPACGGGDIADHLCLPFGEGQVWAFLERYYEGRVSKEALGSGLYVLCGCRTCGLHFQRYALDAEGMDYLYETAVSPEASLAKREQAGPDYFAGLVRNAKQVAALTPSARARDVRVLDFGMGWGHWAAAAKALGHSVYGAEISPRRIAFAASLGVPTVDLGALAPASLDYIHAEQVFEHLATPNEILAALVRLLRPGGVIRLTVPDGEVTSAKLRAGWRVAKDELHPLEHLNAYTRRSLDGMAARHGLTLLPGGWAPRLKRLVRRKRRSPGGYYRKLDSMTSPR